MVHDKKFVGLLSTSTIVRIMAPSDPKLRTFYRQLPGRRDGIANIVAEADTGIALWRKIFKDRYENRSGSSFNRNHFTNISAMRCSNSPSRSTIWPGPR